MREKEEFVNWRNESAQELTRSGFLIKSSLAKKPISAMKTRAKNRGRKLVNFFFELSELCTLVDGGEDDDVEVLVLLLLLGP